MFFKKEMNKNNIFILCLFALFLFLPQNSYARVKSDIWWSTIINVENKQLESYVLVDDSGHAQEKVYNGNLSGAEIDPHNYTILSDKNLKVCMGGQTVKQDAGCNSNKINYIMSWPGAPDNRAFKSEEERYANYVADELTNDFNMAVGLVMQQESDLKIFTSADVRALFADVAMCGIKKGNYTPQKISGITCSKFNSIKQDDSNETFQMLKEKIINTDDYGEYLTPEDFVVFNADGDTANDIILQVRFPKGYAEGQPLNHIIDDVNTFVNEGKISKYVGWNDMIVQANFSSLNRGLDSGTVNDMLVKDSAVEGVINKIFSEFFNGITHALGLYSYRELIFNEGTRMAGYYKGITPYGWFGSASFIYWICQVVVVFMMAYSILLMFIKRGASVLNPALRVSLKEQIFNFVLSIFFMISFLFIFWAMATLNNTLVDLLASLTHPKANLSFGGLMSGSGLAAIFIGFAVMYLTLRMNVFYIVRGLTILILYTLAPIFIALPTFGGRGKEIFTEWFKELVVNIFMQTFHAVILCIFLISVSKGPSQGIERLILMYSFIPITELFKSKFLGSSITDQAANQATNQTKNALRSGANLAKNLGSAGAKAAHGDFKGAANQAVGDIGNAINDASNIGMEIQPALKGPSKFKGMGTNKKAEDPKEEKKEKKQEVKLEEPPKEELPKEEPPKEELPKEEPPKEELPKEELPKEEPGGRKSPKSNHRSKGINTDSKNNKKSNKKKPKIEANNIQETEFSDIQNNPEVNVSINESQDTGTYSKGNFTQSNFTQKGYIPPNQKHTKKVSDTSPQVSQPSYTEIEETNISHEDAIRNESYQNEVHSNSDSHKSKLDNYPTEDDNMYDHEMLPGNNTDLMI